MIMATRTYHDAVMQQSLLDNVEILPDGIYVDATFGGGGHSKAILNELNESGQLYGFDQDLDAHANRIEDERFKLIQGNFRYLRKFLRLEGHRQVDGILADLGVSSHQFDTAERGFSFKKGGVLDMRMNQEQELSARVAINHFSEEELKNLFKNFGELQNAAAIAREIVYSRSQKELQNTSDLVEILEPLKGRLRMDKFMARIFQALRIEVNDEMGALKELLQEGSRILKPGGWFAVMSYHSLEDRMVKHFFRSGNFDDRLNKDLFGKIQRPLEPLRAKPFVPSEKEMKDNPRSRSARLRIAIKS